LTSIVIPNSVTSIGDLAFFVSTNFIIYSESANKPTGWVSSWTIGNSTVYWAGEWHYENGVPVPGAA
jgi:hypothetical protein